MSSRTLLRTGLALGARTVPKLSTTAPLWGCCLALALYLVLRGR